MFSSLVSVDNYPVWKVKIGQFLLSGAWRRQERELEVRTVGVGGDPESLLH